MNRRSRQPSDYEDLLAEAHRFEPRFHRAFIRSIEKQRSAIDVEKLARMISRKDVRAITRYLEDLDLGDALRPAGDIVKDAFNNGGKIGAKRVNEALKGGHK